MKHIVFDCDGTLIDTTCPKYQLFPGIKELLTELSSLYKLYVWTARDSSSTQRILTSLGVFALFEDMSTCDTAPSKPHIGGLQALLGDTDRNTICVIGDTSNDILGAKNFGVLSLGAVWNRVANSRVLKEMGADFIVSHPAECSKLIQLNLKGDDDHV